MAGRTFANIARALRALPRVDKSIAELSRDAMRLALDVVPADGWAVLTLDPATLLATGDVHDTALLDAPNRRRFFVLEYSEDDVAKFATLARELTPVVTLAEATQQELAKSLRYRELLAPAGYEHEVRATLRSMKHTWGALFLARRAASGGFTPDEEAFLRELADAFGDALRATLRAAKAETDARPGRAILVIGDKHEIVVASPGAPALLEELAVDGPHDPHGVPHAVRSTVNGARRGLERGGQTTAHVRVRGRSGAWLTVVAAVLGDGKAVVTIDEGRVIAVAEPLLAAYELDAHEGAVLRDVLHGFDAAQMSARLGVATDTIEADLARVLDKVGVSKAPELASKLFFEHYYERATQGAELNADGWFC